MKKIDNFTNIYKVSKTLKFKLIPVGKTEENFNAKLLENDEKRAENYKKAKLIIDKYFSSFIEKNLSEVKSKKFITLIKKFNDLYFKKDKTDKEKDELKNQITKELRKEIVNCFEQDRAYDILFKGKEILEAILNDKKINEEEYKIISSFDKFSTYFSNFLTNRKNMFSVEEKVGSIAYRLIHENLPIFLSNIKSFEKIKKELSNEIKELNSCVKDLSYGCRVEDIFNIDYYKDCLTGTEISKYNEVIGGRAFENGERVKGINEYINSYNQKVVEYNKEHKDERKPKLPLLKQLYKQILQEGERTSFVIDSLDTKEQIYNEIDKYLNNEEYKKILDILIKSVESLKEYDLQKVYINGKFITNISQKIYGNYNIINMCFEKDYSDTHEKDKGKKKYEENLKKYLKSLKYSIGKIIEVTDKYYNEEKIEFSKSINDIITQLKEKFDKCLIEYKKISKIKPEIRGKEENIEIIKNLLDSIKNIYDYFSMFIIKDLDVDLDEYFYADLSNLQKIDGIIHLYNIVRNYVTKKPYNVNKIKLNFGNSKLLNGWVDSYTEKSDNGTQYGGYLFRKKNSINEYDYYLGISNNVKLFRNTEIADDDISDYERLDYYQLKSDTIYGTSFKDKDENKRFINLKENIKSNNRIPSEKKNKVILAKTLEELRDEVDKIIKEKIFRFTHISKSEMEKAFADSKKPLYLYKIYNKDLGYAENKNIRKNRGRDNLHTIYFKELFEGDYKVFDLAKGEVFYRRGIEKDDLYITHEANKAIPNKYIYHNKKESIFKYPITKNKRFYTDQITLHFGVFINYKETEYNNSIGKELNKKVNDSIKKCKDNYIIGIDRGERNLIYVVVINEKGELKEQISLNEIVNNYNNQEYRTNYHDLLDRKEVDRDKARKNWTTIANIKELKEGYISQVVHKICELVEQYDAIIVMENLNPDFKRGRIKVEKQVYQKFEKMLIDKLNLYVDKNKKPDEIGGVRKAYQLTRPYEGNKNMQFQNGIIYYINPWKTSKIDPTTGFVNLFRFGNYNSVNDRKSLFERMDNIRYNKKEKYFEFDIDYDKFENCSTDYKKKWTVCTYGNRIRTFKNEKKNNEGDTENISLTEELISLFNKYNIDYNNDLKNSIINMTKKEFFDELFDLFKLTLQMRNSDSNNDYLISPVKNEKGVFYNSDDSKKNQDKLPYDADANGAYNIARKGLMIIKRIKKGIEKNLTVISNLEWLEFAQSK